MPEFSELIRAHQPNFSIYEELYKTLHANPGLGLQETLAATVATEHLKQYGFTVTCNIGGYGVLGVLKNGPGKTIMLRADTDALPLEEKTGLSYASKKREVDVEDQIEKPVMHACGHDMHVGYYVLLHLCGRLMLSTGYLHACRS
jgi:metal-dependent amidase/aminoacylase/carboxypeptidase family protein